VPDKQIATRMNSDLIVSPFCCNDTPIRFEEISGEHSRSADRAGAIASSVFQLAPSGSEAQQNGVGPMSGTGREAKTISSA